MVLNLYKKIKPYVISQKNRIAFYLGEREDMRFLSKHKYSQLSNQEKKEIDDYWANFGVKFPNYSWFEMYYEVTGIRDPRFIPDTFARFVLYPFYNDVKAYEGWVDKNFFDKFLGKDYIPLTLCHKFKGHFYDGDWNYYGQNKIDVLAGFIERKAGGDSVVVKDTRDSCAGVGVKIFSFKNRRDILDFLKSDTRGDFIIQKRLIQHPFFSQFNKSSVNILRIISWKHDGKVDILSVSVRFGIQGSFTDVAYVNGQEIVNVVGVDSIGRINDRWIGFGGNSTAIDIEMKEIPYFEETLNVVKEAHLKLPPFDVIGWDVTIDDANNPIIIEYNVKRPGTILYQFANGPLAGDYTSSLLSFLKDQNLKDRYLPKRYKLK